MKKITAMNTTDLKCATRAVADKLAFATLLVPGVVWAQKAGSMSETQGEMCGFLNNITSLLNIGSIAVVTIAIIFAGYQIAFAHKRISDVAPILIGGLLIGAAGQIAKMVIGDDAGSCAVAMISGFAPYYA